MRVVLGERSSEFTVTTNMTVTDGEAWKESCGLVPHLRTSFPIGGFSGAKLSGAGGFALKAQPSSKAAQEKL